VHFFNIIEMELTGGAAASLRRDSKLRVDPDVELKMGTTAIPRAERPLLKQGPQVVRRLLLERAIRLYAVEQANPGLVCCYLFQLSDMDSRKHPHTFHYSFGVIGHFAEGARFLNFVFFHF